MEELDESEIETGSKWKGIIIIAFTVIAISGMMYMLFTVDDYNKYGSGSSSTDTSATDTSKKTVAPTTATNRTQPSTSSTEKPKTSKVVKETPPVVVSNPVKEPQPMPKVETKPQVVKVKEQPVIPKPTPKIEIKQPAPIVVQPKPQVIKPTANTVAKNLHTKMPAPNIPPVKPPVAKPKPVKEDKVMTNGELQDLVNDILAKSSAAGISVRCVQLHNTASGNNKTAIKQIETYLRSQKFTIAGRQMVSSNSKNIQIIPVNNCMRLVVGAF